MSDSVFPMGWSEITVTAVKMLSSRPDALVVPPEKAREKKERLLVQNPPTFMLLSTACHLLATGAKQNAPYTINRRVRYIFRVGKSSVSSRANRERKDAPRGSSTHAFLSPADI